MSIEQMRDAIKKAYPSPGWRAKVDKMADKKVYAVYMSMKNEKRL
jgi:hypothetical protein